MAQGQQVRVPFVVCPPLFMFEGELWVRDGAYETRVLVPDADKVEDQSTESSED